MKKYNEYLFESIYIDMFDTLYDLAPDSLKEEIDKTKKVNQSKKWHPEGNVYIHTKVVTNRLYNTYRDINLTLSGLFHDLGKIYTTTFNTDKESYTAHGHEDKSILMLDDYDSWINERGGDIDVIKYIVANHMRYKYMDDMRMQERIKFIEHPYFDYVDKFGTADYGGTSKKCKNLPDHTEFLEKIEQIKKQQKEKEIIRDKFNGRLIMLQHPDLKGIELGNAINNFKNQSDDFTWYALNTPSEQIMKDFNEFIKTQ